MIGGKAPSKYLHQIQTHAQVQISIQQQDEILRSHLVDPALLRADDFERFYEARKQSLIRIIETATGKTVLPVTAEAPPEDAEDEDEDE